ncbi:hypothetical protein PROFUN_01245 [Planoprotostelium fungivorum]|uniref:Clu domain-containing protein n=1 Tax=Planoprotostelium fungivorum TaxID=1890364 RepID=A0A2P6NZL1_9EUKA|nr:hypothetical protein PROFUN_01245 [Planoprotostelium fungivorum]
MTHSKSPPRIHASGSTFKSRPCVHQGAYDESVSVHLVGASPKMRPVQSSATEEDEEDEEGGYSKYGDGHDSEDEMGTHYYYGKYRVKPVGELIDGDVEDQDWNAEFQLLNSSDGPEKFGKLSQLDQLSTLFIRLNCEMIPRQFEMLTVNSYGKIICSEVCMHPMKKTIKPVHIGGVAGGAKYIVGNILFKFALDTHGLYGAKAAGHELKGLMSFYDCNLHDVSLPLMALIDFKGFRLVAVSLLPISSKTICYGSADGGNTVHAEHPLFCERMKQAGKFMNLQPHLVGKKDPKILYTAGDIEASATSTEISRYVIDFARTFPPEYPIGGDSSRPPSVLHKMLRPEFVQSRPKPLSPDALSAWAVSTNLMENIPPELMKKKHQQDLLEATKFLHEHVIPEFAGNLDEKYATILGELRTMATEKIKMEAPTLWRPNGERGTPISPIPKGPRLHPEGIIRMQTISTVIDDRDLRELMKNIRFVEEMHSRGINVRHLGRVRDACKHDMAREDLLLEMCARAIKCEFRSRMRAQVRALKTPSIEAYRSMAADFVNQILSNDSFWSNMKILLLQKFEKCLSAEEMAPDFHLREKLLERQSPQKLILWIEKVQNMTGIKIRANSIQGIKLVGCRLTKLDIDKLSVKVKFMNIIDFASAMDFGQQAWTEETWEGMEKLYSISDSKFGAALAASPNSTHVWHEWGKMLLSRARRREIKCKREGNSDIFHALADYNEAIDKFSQAVHLHPDLVEGHEGLVETISEQLCVMDDYNELEIHLDVPAKCTKMGDSLLHILRIYNAGDANFYAYDAQDRSWIERLIDWVWRSVCVLYTPLHRRQVARDREESLLENLWRSMEELLMTVAGTGWKVKVLGIMCRMLLLWGWKTRRNVIDVSLSTTTLLTGIAACPLKRLDCRVAAAAVLSHLNEIHPETAVAIVSEILPFHSRLLYIGNFPEIQPTLSDLLLPHFKKLAEVVLDYDQHWSEQELYSFLLHCTSIRRLSVRYCQQFTLSQMVSPSLEQLDCLHCMNLGRSVVLMHSHYVMPSLRSIDLTECTSIGSNFLSIIIRNSPILSSLKINGIPHIKSVTLQNSKLRTLQARDCKNLCTLDIDSASLRDVDVSNCISLVDDVQFRNTTEILTVINVSGCVKLQETWMIPIIKRKHNLRAVDVSSVPLSFSQLFPKYIGKYSQNITTLCLGRTKLLGPFQILSKMDLINLTSLDVTALRGTILFDPFPKLNKLILDEYNQPELLVGTSVHAMLENVSIARCPTLTEPILINLATHIKNLRVINLTSSTAVSDDAIYSLACKSKQLREINLFGCVGITDWSVKKLSGSCNQLERVSLGGCKNISDASAASLCSVNSALRYVDLALTKIKTATLQTMTVHNNLITELDVSGVKVMDDACCEAIASFERLTSLNLYLTPIEDSGLRKILKKLTRLQRLDVSYCGKLTDEAFRDLKTCELRSVNLIRDFSLTDRTLMEIAQRCPKLEDLSVRQCVKITGRGIISVAEKCVHLVHINMKEIGGAEVELAQKIRALRPHTRIDE